MCGRGRFIGIAATALGLGILLAVICPTGFLVFFLGIIVIIIGLCLLNCC